MTDKEAREDAVRELVTALYLYPSHRLNSRGPYGCVLRAIQKLNPDIHREIVENGPDAAYEAHYDDKE